MDEPDNARFYCRQHYPRVLDKFYWILSWNSSDPSSQLRLVDEEVWKQEG